MTFLVKGGFNAFRNHIINIALHPTNYWETGTINILEKNFMINSHITNIIKQIKYTNNMGYALLLNNDVIYESSELCTYDISLNFSEENNYMNTNMYSFIKFECVQL
jgi:hypothetical protein